MTVAKTYVLADGSEYTSRADALKSGLKRVYVTSDGQTFQLKKDALAHEELQGKFGLVTQVLQEHFTGTGHGTKGTITRFMEILKEGNRAENVAVLWQAVQVLAREVSPELVADTIDEKEVQS